jgi:signal transduction histidine kinase
MSVRGLINKTRKHNAQLLHELENSKEKELYAAKIEFFTNITHEIRTPLSLIKAPLDEVLKRVIIRIPTGMIYLSFKGM